jgi:hypothetical protein
VPDDEHFVEIADQNGERLGFGVRLTRYFVLTAEHCIDARATQDTLLKVLLPDGRHVTGTVHDFDLLSDLALLRLGFPSVPPLPDVYFDHVMTGESWKTTYQIPNADEFLSGSIANTSMEYGRTRELSVQAMQLMCDVASVDYRTFSGSPIERRTRHRPPMVLGIVVKPPATFEAPADTMFAGTVEEAVHRLMGIQVVFLLRDMWPRFALAESEPSGDPPIHSSSLIKPYLVEEERGMDDPNPSRDQAVLRRIEESGLGDQIPPLWWSSMLRRLDGSRSDGSAQRESAERESAEREGGGQ